MSAGVEGGKGAPGAGCVPMVTDKDVAPLQEPTNTADDMDVEGGDQDGSCSLDKVRRLAALSHLRECTYFGLGPREDVWKCGFRDPVVMIAGGSGRIG
eukprot:m.382322 g.382322  ORF g.382322 m.382322 type:complete len:98 (-) comp16718_c0_seq62:870-1163(-)